MKIFGVIGGWIKTHVVLTIIIGVVAVGGVATSLILFNNTSKSNSNTLSNGTYSCQLMYNGKSFDDDNVIREWLQKLATYESSIDVDSINISDVRKELMESFDLIFGSSYIVKDNDNITLKVSNGDKVVDFVIYNIGNNQFKLGEDVTGSEDTNEVYIALQNILNQAVVAKQTKDDFTYENFMIIWCAMNLKKDALLEVSSDFEKYTNLDGIGDLVCKTSISDDKEEDSSSNDVQITTKAEVIYKDITDSYSQYIYSYGKSGEIHLGTPGWYHYFDMSNAHDNCSSTYVEDQLACQDMEEVRTYLAYTFYDLDGDNIKELVVAQHGSYYSDTYSPSNEIMGIYYYENKQVKNLYLAPSGEGSNITILEDGYLKYSGGRQGNYYSNFVKKGKSWSKLEQVVSYQTTEEESGLTFTKSVPGEKDEVHKNITWASLGDYDNSYNAVGKFEVDLNKLEWTSFLGQMD